MTVEQANAIDFIGTNEKTGVMTLCVADPLDWSESNKHLLMLQDKINNYLAFIESGDIHKKRPDAKGQKIVIEIRFQYQPNKDARDFLLAVKKVVVGAGFGFEWKSLSDH